MSQNPENSVEYVPTLDEAVSSYQKIITEQRDPDESDVDWLEIQYEGMLENVGIEMMPLGILIRFAKDNGDVASYRRLIPVVKDVFRFSSFLENLHQEDIISLTQDHFFNDILKGFLRATDVYYARANDIDLSEQDRVHWRAMGNEQLNIFWFIESHFCRLNIDENKISSSNFQLLMKRSEYFEKEQIQEYMFAEDQQFITPPREQIGFGPSRWHELPLGRYNWEKALDFWKKLDDDVMDFSELANEVRQGLLVSIDSAISKLELLEEELKGIDNNDYEDITDKDYVLNNLKNIRDYISGERSRVVEHETFPVYDVLGLIRYVHDPRKNL